MKLNRGWIAVTLLLILSCKKEIKQTVTIDETATNTISCGNNWVHASDFNFKAANPVMVYNNKAYFFSNIPGQAKQIAIFDGTNWEVIDSDIPIETISGNNNFSFVIGNKGYVGRSQYPGSHPLYEYNFDTNEWGQKASFPGSERGSVAVFTRGNTGYLVGGGTTVNPTIIYNEVWSYNTITDTWIQLTNFPYTPRGAATGFGINNIGYAAAGANSLTGIYFKELMRYDPGTSPSWTLKVTFPGAARSGAVNFVINGKAYVGGGANSEVRFIDFYKYDPAINEWNRIADAPGSGRIYYAFSLNGKGYIVRVPEVGVLSIEKYIPPFCFTGSGVNP